MKFKKGNVSEVLSFVLIFTLFFSFMIAYLFNNIIQERRSAFIDELNKQAMSLQVKLEGYSTTFEFCNMYRNGSKITSSSSAESEKNIAIQQTKDAIKKYFDENSKNNLLQLNSLNDIQIEILDGPNVKDIARVKITVKYYATFKTPYNKNDGGDGGSSSKIKLSLKDTATRVIENPIRQKNTKK